ncbi:hypothetical protein [Neorhizobium galegae]|uniref:hypothetical protein n=1 Tax=Neorhizobium galegae TaxID=399 RepID=UPI00127BA541|nr:hypothetical protein [Neorhizobium galegae]KAA9386913.1 hypothetical protein F4V88_10745 [Neorhizobium galegae]MCM2499889.1 hypothetical protein [Neorhizobium galegae]MCQ1771306.1 hypothetical protein [Neorhizobium galegae]MCQ1799808.1 hypothetical protein [Neorhizobium galegae]
MRESRHLGQIARLFHQPISKVRQTLRQLREAGMLPGKSGGDLQPRHLVDVVLGLTSDGIQASPAHVRALRRLPLRDATDLPATAGEMLRAVVETMPRSPVLGDLDLDDGRLLIADNSIALECLSLSGKRSVVRYGDENGPTSHIHQFQLNSIREIAVLVETPYEYRKTQTQRSA